MVDASACAESYADVRDDKTETNWAVFTYDDSNKALQVAGKGSGGFGEMKASGLFPEDALAYAFVRFVTGDEESKRAKFAFLSWCGPGTKPLRRAKMSVHKADVKKVVQSFAIEYHAESMDELDEETIVKTIKKAGGADYGTGAAKE